MNKTLPMLGDLVLLAPALSSANALAPDFKPELTPLTREMDIAQYETPLRDAQIKAFDALTARAIELGKKYPDHAEPLVLQALALDPVGIEQNLGYAHLQFNAAAYTGASKYATAASRPPTRPGRHKADADLHAQAEALITKTKEKLR